jgi:hypothetical protein
MVISVVKAGLTANYIGESQPATKTSKKREQRQMTQQKKVTRDNDRLIQK